MWQNKTTSTFREKQEQEGQFPPNMESKWMKKETKHYKNKSWRQQNFIWLMFLKCQNSEFTDSKIWGFKFRNSYQVQVLPYQLFDLYLFSQNEIQLAPILILIFYILDCHSEKSFYETVQVYK